MSNWNARLSLALLVTFSVLVCYCFEWDRLRWFTAEILVRIGTFCGLRAQHLTWDVIEWEGTPIRFTIACTFVDVFFGAAVIIWNRQYRLVKNMGQIAALAILLFSFNLFRLAVGFWLHARGLPWVVAHDVVAGFAYFAVWSLLSNRFSGDGVTLDCSLVEPPRVNHCEQFPTDAAGNQTGVSTPLLDEQECDACIP